MKRVYMSGVFVTVRLSPVLQESAHLRLKVCGDSFVQHPRPAGPSPLHVRKTRKQKRRERKYCEYEFLQISAKQKIGRFLEAANAGNDKMEAWGTATISRRVL